MTVFTESRTKGTDQPRPKKHERPGTPAPAGMTATGIAQQVEFRPVVDKLSPYTAVAKILYAARYGKPYREGSRGDAVGDLLACERHLRETEQSARSLLVKTGINVSGSHEILAKLARYIEEAQKVGRGLYPPLIKDEQLFLSLFTESPSPSQAAAT